MLRKNLKMQVYLGIAVLFIVATAVSSLRHKPAPRQQGPALPPGPRCKRERRGNEEELGTAAASELAIYYEHKARDPEQARQIVRQALDELRRAIQVGDIAPGPYREIKARFDNRLQRLERKKTRPLLEGLVSRTET